MSFPRSRRDAFRCALLVTPFWEEGRHHPHRRRIEQWCEGLRERGFEVVLVGLGTRATARTWRYGQVFTDLHPRLARRDSRLVLAKGGQYQQVMRQRISALLNRIGIASSVDLAIAAHPVVATLLDPHLPRTRTIVDILNSPEGRVTDATETSNLLSAIEGRWVVALSESEVAFLDDHSPRIAGQSRIPPTLHHLLPSPSLPPHRVTLFGAATPASFDELLAVFTRFLPRTVRNRYSLTVEVCGEVSCSLASSGSFRVTGPVSDLELAGRLHNAICILPPPVYSTGLSFRVIDAVGSGAFLLAAQHAVRGYSLRSDEHYFAVETPDAVVAAIRRIFQDPARAITMAVQAREHLGRMSSLAAHSMKNLLTTVMSTDE